MQLAHYIIVICHPPRHIIHIHFLTDVTLQQFQRSGIRRNLENPFYLSTHAARPPPTVNSGLRA